MNKVLLSAFIGSKNLGDEAIFATIVQFLDKQNIDLSVVTRSKTKTRKKTKAKLVDAVPWSNIAKAIKQTDILLMGGGGIIQDESSILNAFYFLPQVFVARVHRKKVIWCFVGVGPIKHWLTKWMLRHAVKGVHFAIVRDEVSAQILRDHGMNGSKILVSSDPAIDYEPIGKLAASPFAKNKPYIVIAPRRWFFSRTWLPVRFSEKLHTFAIFRKKYDNFLATLTTSLQAILERHPDLTIVGVPFYGNQDPAVTAELKQRLPVGRFLSFKAAMSEEEYLSIVKDSELLIGMRLHSLILAARVNVPFIALSYSLKTREFTKSLDASDSMLNVAQLSGSQLEDKVDEMLKYKQSLASAQKKAAEKLSAKNQAAFEKLGELLTT